MSCKNCLTFSWYSSDNSECPPLPVSSPLLISPMFPSSLWSTVLLSLSSLFSLILGTGLRFLYKTPGSLLKLCHWWSLYRCSNYGGSLNSRSFISFRSEAILQVLEVQGVSEHWEC